MQRAGVFVSEQLRAELQHRSYLIQAQPHPEAEGDLGVPPIVGGYHTLYPLEDVASPAAEVSSPALGVTTQARPQGSRGGGRCGVAHCLLPPPMPRHPRWPHPSRGPTALMPGIPLQVAKAISGHDGQAYALRRIDGRQVRCWHELRLKGWAQALARSPPLTRVTAAPEASCPTREPPICAGHSHR